MRNSLISVSMLALAMVVAPACATKTFVRTEVGNVNAKVDSLTATVAETQERTQQNEARIGQVDQKAEAAGRSATDARAAADAAATTAKNADARAMAVGGRVDTVEAASRKLIYTVTLSEDQGNFQFDRAALPEAAKTRLDQMITDLKADPQNIYIEVEGHTDNIGSQEYNQELGLERAEAVTRYLYEQHQVPLHKMHVISYGEEKPASPNNTREGRARNRRVVVRILT